MSRTIGTVVRGVRAPIFRQGDDVVSIAADTVVNALAKAFNQGVGFGIGLLLLPFIFQLILGFGSAQYRDGTRANTQPDMVEDVVNKAKDAVSGNHNDNQEQ